MFETKSDGICFNVQIFSRMKGLREKLCILTNLTNGDIAMKEACQKAEEYKKLDVIKKAFVWEAKVPSWEGASRLYPQHTTTDSLSRFLSCRKFCTTLINWL